VVSNHAGWAKAELCPSPVQTTRIFPLLTTLYWVCNSTSAGYEPYFKQTEYKFLILKDILLFLNLRTVTARPIQDENSAILRAFCR